MVTARNKTILRTITLLITIFSLNFPARAQYSGGTGESDDPYQIATAADLILLGETTEDYDKHFILTADIDMDPTLPGRKVFDEAVIAWDGGGPFTGVFDGNNHTISHLTIRGRFYLGLFGRTAGAKISNLGLEAVDVNGTGDYVGGLVGVNGGSITNCYSTGSVSGGSGYVGGLVGYNKEGSIMLCYSTGTVNGNSVVGGLVGSNGSFFGNGIITNSYSTGTVNGNNSVGGLVGTNGAKAGRGIIANSYSTSMVTGDESVGGLVGENGTWGSGSITNSYSTGVVTGNNGVGGLVGDSGGSINSSFWDIETSGLTVSDGGVGLTTAEMQDINTYLNAGWDFVDDITNGTYDFWQILPGEYPRLRYQDSENLQMPEGSGTAEQPYLIRDTADLGTVWLEPLAHYRLETSLDLSGITWSMAVVPKFGGIFDGNGHTISHLTISGDSYLGLFGETGSGARISNLGLEAVGVNGTGDCVGGLVGYNEGSITSSYSIGSVSGDAYVGGLVGYNLQGTITASYSTGSVTGIDCVGGLVGYNYFGSITSSYSTGTVSGDRYVGGLVGRNPGSITMSYSTGAVDGNDLVGGLVGRNHGNITSSYSTGSVSADQGSVGGLVGENENVNGSVITSSFWDIETSGLTNMCGSQVDDAMGCDDSFGKTTAEMQTASTFLDAGWDFIGETDNGTEDIWSICEGTNYPRFVWQIPPADFVCPDGITLDDFVYFIEHWEDDNCDQSNDYCYGTDLDFSGTVDNGDLEILINYWLAEAQ